MTAPLNHRDGHGEVRNGRNRNWRPWLLAFAALIVALDRLTKMWVNRHVALDDAIPVIPRFFRISHVLNPGAAFSLFNDSSSPGRVRILLIAFSALAAIVVFLAILKMGRRLTATTVALACILGGALGNVYDRIRFGTVIDFLEVHIFSYHWPDFNVADSAIVVGGILLLLDSVLSPDGRSPDNRSEDGRSEDSRSQDASSQGGPSPAGAQPNDSAHQLDSAPLLRTPE